MKKILLSLGVLVGVLLLITLISCNPPQADNNTPDKTPEKATATETKSPEPEPSPIVLSEEEQKKAEEFTIAIKDNKLDRKELSNKENAKIFLYLADTGQDEPVILTALQGMTNCYSATTESLEPVNQDYHRVVLKHLNSASNPVLGRALEASKHSLGGETPNKPTIEKLVDIAKNHKEPVARHDALDLFYYVKGFGQDPQIFEAYMKALDSDQSYIRSIALFRMNNASQLVDKESAYKKIKEMFKDPDAGVRGRAVTIIYRLTPDADQTAVAQELMTMLDDKDPYVRSAVAGALADMRYKPAIHKLVTLLDDTAKNTYDINFTKLTGDSGYVHHDGSPWSRVDDAVLFALKNLTWDMNDKKFDYASINWKAVDEEIKQESAKAKKWYDTYKDSIPKE